MNLWSSQIALAISKDLKVQLLIAKGQKKDKTKNLSITAEEKMKATKQSSDQFNKRLSTNSSSKIEPIPKCSSTTTTKMRASEIKKI